MRQDCRYQDGLVQIENQYSKQDIRFLLVTESRQALPHPRNRLVACSSPTGPIVYVITTSLLPTVARGLCFGRSTISGVALDIGSRSNRVPSVTWVLSSYSESKGTQTKQAAGHYE